MIIFDLALIIILFGFVFYGLFFGLIRTFGSLAGLVIGVWLAKIFYLPVYNLVHNLFFGYETVGKVIIFLLLFGLINRLVCFGFALLDRTYNLLSIIPFLKTINRLAGAIFGFILGGIVLGLIFYVIALSPFLIKLLGGVIKNSQVVPYLIKFIAPLIPFIPDFLEKIKDWLFDMGPNI